MAKKNIELSAEQKLQNSITGLFENNKKIFLIISAAVVLLILVLIVVSASVTSSKNKAMIRIQELQEKVDSFSTLDDAEKEALFQDLTAEEKKNGYSSVKASYLKGLAYYSSEKWQEAYDSFMTAVDKDSSSYLAPLSLVNAAACSELLGNTQQALDLYNRIADYPVSGVGAKALFNIGRIYLQMDNKALAESVFNQLIDKYSSGLYVSLAKDILLNISDEI